MPRAKLPEYFKEYKVEIHTYADTPAMALRFHREKVDYHKRWIKGTLIDEDIFGGQTDNITTTLTYIKGGADGQVGQGDEHGEEEDSEKLSAGTVHRAPWG